MPDPVILGHEICGNIAEIGNGVKKFKPGERVIIPATITCNQCLACKSWNETHCENSISLGKDAPGGFAEYVTVPETHPFRLPHEHSYETGSLISNLFVGAYHLVFDRINIHSGEKVVIFGSGGFGLSILQMAKLRGAKVYMVDIFDWKLQKAKEYGAEGILNSNKVDICEEGVMETIGGRADIVVETIGAPRTLMQSMNSLKKGGRLVLGGYTDNALPFLVGRIIRNEIAIIGASGAPRRKIPEVLQMIDDKKIQWENMVSHQFDLEHINDAINTLRMGQTIRSVIYPWGIPKEKQESE